MNLKTLRRLAVEAERQDKRIARMKQRLRQQLFIKHAETCSACALQLKMQRGQFTVEDMVRQLASAAHTPRTVH